MVRVANPIMDSSSDIRPGEAVEHAPDLPSRTTPLWKIDEDKLCSRCADSMRAALSVAISGYAVLSHHETIAKLEHSAEIENCEVCRLVISTYPESEIETLQTSLDSHLSASVGWWDAEHTCWVLKIVRSGQNHVGAVLYLLPANGSIKSSVLSTFTGDPKTLGLAKNWFTKCCTSHDACKPRNPLTYPKWILSIHQGKPIHLVTGSDLQPNHPPYATLSHCWGTARPLMLTTGCLSNFLSEIPEASLPKTFRDAINIVRSFGLEYLWIDSLCIAQDDLNEWQQESMKMADIYQGSTLNIAATGAEDSSVGLHFTRDSKSMRRIEGIRIPVRNDAINRELYIDVFAQDVYQAGIENSPLAARGWYLQERFLAPRTLHFAKTQVFWECQTIKCCETFPNGVPRMYRPLSLRQNVVNISDAPNPPQDQVDKFEMLKLFRSNKIHDRQLAPKSLAEIWVQCVSTYSQTKLTLQSDKLVAISGIARWIHGQTTHGENTNVYLAGLWRENLHSQLVWSVVDRIEDIHEDEYHHTRPTQYLAPSWSWASTNRCVRFYAAYNDEVIHKSTMLVDIVEARTELLVKDDEFGQVTGGTIKIEFTDIFSDIVSFNSPEVEPRNRTIWWDYDIGQEQTVYLLPIVFRDERYSVLSRNTGLVLKEVSNAGTTPHFTRLGCFTITGDRAKVGNAVKDLSRFETRVNGKRCYCLSII
ncbi:heterokaryon incompatibility protein-domain-containing protein [Xylaria curta]|nr:heterokaryon incompatibility protein-domain-containing protein [Xylaria curta]